MAWGSAAQVREAGAAHRAPSLAGLVDGLVAGLVDLEHSDAAGHPALGPDQLVHGDLAGNVLLDATGTPVVIDLAPYWRPALWAEAVCVLDAVLWHGADPQVLEPWRHGVHQQAMLRAAVFRLLSEEPGSGTAEALARILDPSPLRVL